MWCNVLAEANCFLKINLIFSIGKNSDSNNLSVAGMRFIKRQLTARQEAAPAEQATEPSGDDDDDFFVKRRSHYSGLVQLDDTC